VIQAATLQLYFVDIRRLQCLAMKYKSVENLDSDEAAGCGIVQQTSLLVQGSYGSAAIVACVVRWMLAAGRTNAERTRFDRQPNDFRMKQSVHMKTWKVDWRR
jgi:hypothetical protein